MKSVKEMTEEELRKQLITLDGAGKDFKEQCLNELLDRTFKNAQALYINV